MKSRSRRWKDVEHGVIMPELDTWRKRPRRPLRFISPDAARRIVWRHRDLLRVRLDSYTITTLVWSAQVCPHANGVLNTSTFSNVQITGGDGGAPAVIPAAPQYGCR
jgi:hypothetical protein